MLLAVDIGNSSITIGGFRAEEEPVFSARLSSIEPRTADEYITALLQLLRERKIDPQEITDCAVASVVPQLTHSFEEALSSLCSCRVLTVGTGVRTGFSICTDAPAEVGADIIANAAAAAAKAPGAAILADIGTATTVFAVNAKKELIGGVILPGIASSMEGLRASTAQLPAVALQPPKSLLGKNTADCIANGVLQGHAFALDGFIDAFKQEKGMADATVFATGGLCHRIAPLCRNTMQSEPFLTLKGLRIIYEKTRKKTVC